MSTIIAIIFVWVAIAVATAWVWHRLRKHERWMESLLQREDGAEKRQESLREAGR